MPTTTTHLLPYPAGTANTGGGGGRGWDSTQAAEIDEEIAAQE